MRRTHGLSIGATFVLMALVTAACGPRTPTAPPGATAPTGIAATEPARQVTLTDSPTTKGAPPTATPAPEKTKPPTATSVPQANTAAPTQTDGPIAPYAGAPLCPAHDPTTYHGLWNETLGCHYDHEHGDDPALGNAIFGPVAVAWGGQAISYPWATSGMENTMKHGGYKYSVRTPSHNPLPACGTSSLFNGGPSHCIVAERTEFHIIASSMDSLARYHSYYEELKICAAPAFTECGVMRMGGWADFGQLNSPYAGGRVIRPGGQLDFGDGMVMTFAADASWGDLPATSGEPYVAVENTSGDTQAYLENHCKYQKNCDYMQGIWSMNDLDTEPHPAADPPHNTYIRFLVRTFDDWNLLELAEPNRPFWFCRDGACEMNGSVRVANEVSANVPAAWDTDGDGFVTISGYTDRWGNPRPPGACTALGLDCVPYSLEHVPVGVAHADDPGNGRDERTEYDVSPDGVHWIRFPN